MAANYLDFEPGLLVVFSGYAHNRFQKLTAQNIAKFGEGPYEVVKVECIFSQHPCNCGAGHDILDYFFHSDSCDAYLYLKNIHHHQWVTIKTKTGEETFSGAYLQEAIPETAQQ